MEGNILAKVVDPKVLRNKRISLYALIPRLDSSLYGIKTWDDK
jgi:hypothetical protein